MGFAIGLADSVVHGGTCNLTGSIFFISGLHKDHLKTGDDLAENLFFFIVQGVHPVLELFLFAILPGRGRSGGSREG